MIGSVSIWKKLIISYIPGMTCTVTLLRMSPHPKSISLTSDVSLFISRLPVWRHGGALHGGWHMCVAWAGLPHDLLCCFFFFFVEASTVTLMNSTRFSQGEGHSRTMTKLSGVVRPVRSRWFLARWDLCFARMVRAISFGRGFWMVRLQEFSF